MQDLRYWLCTLGWYPHCAIVYQDPITLSNFILIMSTIQKCECDLCKGIMRECAQLYKCALEIASLKLEYPYSYYI